jgi:glycine oxidase
MNVLVVGGGIMGLSVALDLAKSGVNVTVLERAVFGAEASSAAAGMLAPQLEMSGPGPYLDLCLRSRGLYPAWAKELEERSGVDVDYVESGSLSVAFTEAEAYELDGQVAWQRAAGLRADFLTAAELKRLEPKVSDKALAGAHHPDDHQVDPTKLLKALSIAAARAGALFRTGYVRSLVEEKGQVTGADVDGERLTADYVVLAAGSWSGLVAGGHVDPRVVKPARGQMVGLELRQPPTRCFLKSASGYVVPRTDGRVICGSTMELVGYDKRVTAKGVAKILSAAMELIPELAEAAVTSTWSGLRPWSQDGLPLLGDAGVPGLLLATGHFRNGILLAPITAKVIGQLIRNERVSLDLGPFRARRLPS